MRICSSLRGRTPPVALFLETRVLNRRHPETMAMGGVRRLQVGIESFDPRVLPVIGRPGPSWKLMPVRFDRFGECREHPERFGLRLSSHRSHPYVSPLPAEEIAAFACFFEEAVLGCGDQARSLQEIETACPDVARPGRQAEAFRPAAARPSFTRPGVIGIS